MKTGADLFDHAQKTMRQGQDGTDPDRTRQAKDLTIPFQPGLSRREAVGIMQLGRQLGAEKRRQFGTRFLRQLRQHSLQFLLNMHQSPHESGERHPQIFRKGFVELDGR